MAPPPSPIVRLVLATAIAAVTWGTSPIAVAGDRVKTRLVLDHADAQPSFFNGLARVRLFVTGVTLEGARIPVSGADGFVIKLAGSKKPIPYVADDFARSDAELALTVVLQVGYEFANDVDVIVGSLAPLLSELPRSSGVAVVAYGEGVDGGRRHESPGTAAKSLSRTSADTAPADPLLLKAVTRAITTLKRLEPTQPGAHLRMMVVVISDGKDIDPTPENYRKVGSAGSAAGIPIHTIAFAPTKNLRPLLGLGELSKRSGGTFRWVRSREGFPPQLAALFDEINRQYVLSFLQPSDQVADKKVSVVHKDLESNDVKIPRVMCADNECAASQFCAAGTCTTRGESSGTSLVRWLIYIGIAVSALVVVLFLVGVSMTRADERRKRAEDAIAAHHARQAQAQQAAVSHQIAPVGPQGQQRQPPVQQPAAHSRGPVLPAGVAPQTTPRPPDPTSQQTGSLVVVRGPNPGQTLALRHGFMIGAGPECDLSLPTDRAVSRHHAQFLLHTDGGCSVIDKGSTNGTHVNGVRLTGQVQLRHGNIIRVGSTEVRYLGQ